MADRLASPLLRGEALRAIERRAGERLGHDALMRRAGEAAARVAATMTLERPGPVLVLAGPGNNGGDARIAAAELARRGIDVRVVGLDDGDEPPALVASATLVVDGLFGIGLKRPPSGRARIWIEAVNAGTCPVLALDVPSGLDADTGRVLDVAIAADRTITFIADKPGLHTADGPDHAGDVVVDVLGLEPADFADARGGALNRPALFGEALRPRRRNSHKGSFGSLVVIGGDTGMVGAGLLAARMALFAGAGRVYVRLVGEDAPAFDVVHPELMIRRDLDAIDADAIAIGPGLGHAPHARDLLTRALDAACPIVVDADALNALARDNASFARLKTRVANGHPPAVLTPHPLEAARLLATDANAVGADRVGAALELAKRGASIVVLKGAGTVIASPDGSWIVNPTGNAGLASGGTGDVLCGLVGALLAQGASPRDAALAGVWLHGTAADDLVAAGVGPVGLTASELMHAIRVALNRETR